jgi:hypothetical protein
MSRARDRTFAVASVLFGANWLFAAVAKVWTPLPAYEFTARAVPPGIVAKSLFVAAVAAEALLGSLMLLRAISPMRGFAVSLAGLAAAAAMLLHVRSKAGGLLQCGCYGHVFFSSIDGELALDAVMAAILVALLVWGFATRARSPSA